MLFNSEKITEKQGFTMIEMVVVIAVIGILATVAVPMIGSITANARYAETQLEMEALASAIRGDRDLYNQGHRADFGYFGDVGALPASLDHLVLNPGGFTSWKGPYISNNIEEISGDFKTDAWGEEYVYSGGNTILSIGSGDTIVCNLTAGINRMLYNTITGNVHDIDGTPPQSDYFDSIVVRMTAPDGAGAYSTITSSVQSGGYFAFDSIPAGKQALEIIYLPRNDTLNRKITVIPDGENHLSLAFNANFWYDEITLVPEGLVGYWRFNQTSGITAYDESGAGNDAELNNMDPATDWVSGRIGNALSFDGSDDYLDCGNDTELELSQLSIACWVRTSQSGPYRQLLGKNKLSGNDGYYFSLHQMKPSVYLGGVSSEGWHEALSSIASNTWTHVAFTYDGSKIIIYINGMPDRVISSVSGAVNPNSGQAVWIGSRSDIANREFEGYLDDVRLYNRALSGFEVARLANL